MALGFYFSPKSLTRSSTTPASGSSKPLAPEYLRDVCITLASALATSWQCSRFGTRSSRSMVLVRR